MIPPGEGIRLPALVRSFLDIVTLAVTLGRR
jgi:hypothetical protein